MSNTNSSDGRQSSTQKILQILGICGAVAGTLGLWFIFLFWIPHVQDMYREMQFAHVSGILAISKQAALFALPTLTIIQVGAFLLSSRSERKGILFFSIGFAIFLCLAIIATLVSSQALRLIFEVQGKVAP